MYLIVTDHKRPIKRSLSRTACAADENWPKMEMWVEHLLYNILHLLLYVFVLNEMYVFLLSLQYCWRWTGFNYGFDLLVTYTNRFIIFKRNTLSQPCGGAVSLQPRRHLAYRWAFTHLFISHIAYFCYFILCRNE